MIYFLLKRILYIINAIMIVIISFAICISIAIDFPTSKDIVNICIALISPVILLNVVAFFTFGFKITFDEKEIRHLWFGLVYKRTAYDKICAISIRCAKTWKGISPLKTEDGRYCAIISLYSSDMSLLVNRQNDIGDAIVGDKEQDCILKILFSSEYLQTLINKTPARIYLSKKVIKQYKPEISYFIDNYYNRFYKRESGFSKLISQGDVYGETWDG